MPRIHLHALQHVVRRLREQCREQLILQKAAFSAARRHRHAFLSTPEVWWRSKS